VENRRRFLLLTPRCLTVLGKTPNRAERKEGQEDRKLEASFQGPLYGTQKQFIFLVL